MSRREAVLQWQSRARHIEKFRILLLGDVGSGVAHQRCARHEQALRLFRFRLDTPALECHRRIDVGGNALGVECVDRLVIDEHVLASGFVLELGDVGDELAVVREKRCLGRPFAGH